MDYVSIMTEEGNDYVQNQQNFTCWRSNWFKDQKSIVCAVGIWIIVLFFFSFFWNLCAWERGKQSMLRCSQSECELSECDVYDIR